MLKIKKGQSTMEYTTIIMIVIAALLTIGVYFKRGAQGKWKESIDMLGDQYDPLAANTAILQSTSSRVLSEISTVQEGNMVYTARKDSSNSVETRSGSSRMGSYW